jgi:hypothetical protein
VNQVVAGLLAAGIGVVTIVDDEPADAAGYPPVDMMAGYAP